MATVKDDCVLKFQTNKDSEMEQTTFRAGDPVTVVQSWDHHYLIKDDAGHFYNARKELIEE